VTRAPDMQAGSEPAADKGGRYRQCLDGLVSLMAIGSLSSGTDPGRTVDTLLEALSHVLGTSFTFARVSPGPGRSATETLRVSDEWAGPRGTREWGEALQGWTTAAAMDSPHRSSLHLDGQELWVASVPLGRQGELGAMAAGATRIGFPDRTERLILEVAASQATLTLQQATLHAHEAEALLRTETALHEAERESLLIVDAIPGLVALLTPNGEVDVANAQLLDHFGQSLEQLKQWGSNGTVHPDDLAHVAEAFTSSVAAGQPYEILQRLRRADGVYRWMQNRGFPLRARTGQIARWCVLLTDIEDQKRAEESLRESEREARLIVDTIPGLVVILTQTGDVEFINGRTVEYLGLALSAAKDWASNGIVHPGDMPRVLPVFAGGVAAGGPFEYEVRLRHRSGEYRWFQLRAHPLRDINGGVGRWYVLLSDIDEARCTEEALRDSEREFRLIVQSVAGMIAVFSPGGELNGGNQQLLDYFQQPLEEVGRWASNGMIHLDDLQHSIDCFVASLGSGEPYDFETRIRRFDGTFRWFQIRGHPLRDANGQIVRWYGLLTDIDDRKRAEEHLAANEHRFRLAINALPAPAWSTSPDGDCDFLSERCFEKPVYSNQQALGPGWRDALHPDDAPRFVEKWKSALASGSSLEIEARMRRFDGAYRWFLFQDNPLRDESGTVVRWYGACLDIEDRKRAEEALQAREVDLRLIINTISGMICLFTPDGQLEGANQQFLDYLRQSFEDARNWATNGNAHPDDLPDALAAFTHSMATGEPYDFESRVRRFDGEFRWFHIRGKPHRDAEGRIVRWYALLTDIDDRKRAERALEVSERNLRLTIDTIPALAWSARADGTADFFNRHYLDYVGSSVQQMCDRKWTSSVHPDDLAIVEEAWASLHGAGTAGELEARIRRYDGTYRWFLFRANPLRDEVGNIVKWYGVNTDIEDRKRAETALKRSETFLAEGQRISATGSFSWRLANDELTFSGELNRIFGFEPGVVVTFERILDRVHPEDLPALAQKMGDVRSGRDNPEYEIRLQMPDDTIKHVRVFGRVVPHPDGSLECLGAVQDVTQRKLAEGTLDKVRSELAHVTRVMSFGALTASIAHEVNQPLSGIITNASTCVRMLASNPPNVEGAIETARRTIRDGNRASEVVAHLRKLFSKETERSVNIDLNEAAAEVITLLSSDLQRNRIVVQTDFADRLPFIAADRVQLQQVILNLLVNASDAMSTTCDRQRLAVIRTARDGDEKVRLSVEDAGVGINIEDTERLFQPFFTTKKNGMGIGLSVSRSIIESHHGRLWAEPNAEGGATFAFTIPVTLKESRAI
jgi:PAS domain S-box-containing protein